MKTCTDCGSNNQESRVYPQGTLTTAMAVDEHFDELGNHHMHDPNYKTTTYECTEGHTWTESFKVECPACDYNHDG